MKGLRWIKFWWAGGLFLVCLVWYLSLTSTPPDGPDFFIIPFDKASHTAAYFTLSFWFFQLLEKPYFLKICVLFTLQGMLLEIIQYFTGFRNMELVDVVANTLGAFLPYFVVRRDLDKLFLILEQKLKDRFI